MKRSPRCSTHVENSKPCLHRHVGTSTPTITRLIELYEAWGKPRRAAIYRVPFVL